MGCTICGAMWSISIVIVALILASKINATVRYYLKFVLFAIFCVLFTTVPIPLMLLKPRNSKNALFPAAGLRWSARFLGLKTTVNGKENIVRDSGCVVLINHQSALDLIVLAELWPIMDKCAVISKKEIFYIWPFGLASWLWGTIFIDRLKADKAQEAVNKTGKYIKEHEHRVLIFPEGKRSLKGKLLPFKKGAFHLALAAQCPIQPVVVNSYRFLGDRKFDSGDINITILPAIPTKGSTKDDISSLCENTYNTMSNYFEKVSNLAVSNPNNNSDKAKTS